MRAGNSSDGAVASAAGGRADGPLSVLLGLSALPVLLQIFIPQIEFIHRADDTYYYFQVAYNFARDGFWTFDGLHPTNGVQPLWAWMLTSVAVLARAAGIEDKALTARLFVGLTVAVHLFATWLLFRLLARRVSLTAGVVASGAYLFSMGLVWAHSWGMENSVYMLLLVACVAFWTSVEDRPARAALFGVLLGVTTLARLNAGIFAVIAIATLAIELRHRPARALGTSACVALAFSLVVAPYISWNYVETGHPLPVSGRVKSLHAEQYVERNRLGSKWAPGFLPRVINRNRYPLSLFISGAMTDAMWPLGSRIVFSRNRGIGPIVFVPVLGCLAVLLGWRRRAGRRLLATGFGRLALFAPLAIYAFINGLLSIWLYPSQVGYAITQWWLVESELLMIVAVGTLVAVTLEHVGGFARSPARRQWFLRAALAVSIVFHTTQTVGFYWDGRYNVRNWNASWNDYSYRAAQWLARHAPPDARVGSWNAGVLGYYATQRVVNLDGLINSHGLVPYLAERRTADYVRAKRLRYLSDVDGMFDLSAVRAVLPMREIYSEYMPLLGQHYRIYEVAHD
jgi:hypothetical protein